MPCQEEGYQKVLGRYLCERQGCDRRGAVSDEVAKMPGDDPEVLHLPAMLLLSFGLQFSETEFCTWLGCVMESYPTYCRLCLSLCLRT
jgi:hypothetical protein